MRWIDIQMGDVVVFLSGLKAYPEYVLIVVSLGPISSGERDAELVSLLTCSREKWRLSRSEIEGSYVVHRGSDEVSRP